MFSKSREQSLESFVQLSGHSNIKNCFLMPTEGSEIIDKGKARLDMLSDLKLEDIQIRLIPADMLFDCYLGRKKIAIEKLTL